MILESLLKFCAHANNTVAATPLSPFLVFCLNVELLVKCKCRSQWELDDRVSFPAVNGMRVMYI